jgi:hypothetical protein
MHGGRLDAAWALGEAAPAAAALATVEPTSAQTARNARPGFIVPPVFVELIRVRGSHLIA